MSIRPTRSMALAATAAVALSGLIAAAPAQAQDGDVIKRGACSNGSQWKLKLGARDGVIETSFEVDSNVPGQTWSVMLTDNGASVFNGTTVTNQRSGSFTVRVRPTDQPGTDAIAANASFAGTGETCDAAAAV